MDVVTSTAFSVDIDSLNNPKDPFVTNIKKMLKFDLFSPLFLTIVLFPFIIPVLDKMNYTFFPTSVTDFFYAALKKIKSKRVAKDHKKVTVATKSSLYPDQRVTAVTRIQYVSRPDGGSAPRKDLYIPERPDQDN